MDRMDRFNNKRKEIIMKYIYELNDSQFKEYNILASKKLRGLIT